MSLVQKKKRVRFTCPLEDQEQIAVVQYLELKNLKFTAIPNSTYTTSWNQKRKNKDTGLRAGLPDLLIIIKEKLVFIEMKRIKGSSTPQEQIDWITALNMVPNVSARICKGSDEAIEFINNF